jgi:hypothetical protein
MYEKSETARHRFLEGAQRMTSTFWSNTIWYVLLGVITAAELAAIFTKVKNRKRTLAFFLAVSGLTFSLEMLVYSYLKAYQYFPMLTPQSPSDDSIAGNLFSQLFISATALLIAVYNLKFIWFIVFAVITGAIEEWFKKSGIYRQNWYRTWMTVLGLPPIYWTVKKIYMNTISRIAQWQRYFLIYLGLVTLYQLTIVWPLRLSGLRVFSETFLPDIERSLVVLAAANMIFFGVISMAIYFSRLRKSLKICAILLLYIPYYVQTKMGWIIDREGWFLASTSVCIWGMYFYTYVLDRFLGHHVPLSTSS